MARKFAEYFLILLKPWSAEENALPGPLDWNSFTAFVDQLINGVDGNGPSLLDSTRLKWLRNMAAGLRVPGPDRTAVQKFRCRAATRWAAETEANTSFEPEVDRNAHLTDDADMVQAEEAIEFMRNLAHMDDRETEAAVEEAIYVEATVNHLERVSAALEARPVERFSTSDARRFIILDSSSGKRVLDALKKRELIEDREEAPMVDDEEEPTIDVVSPPADVPAPSPSSPPASLRLNADQRAIYDQCRKYFIDHARSVRQSQPLPTPFRLFVHGGPGTGKSFLCNMIVEAAQTSGYAVRCIAPTGIAAANLPTGRTIHNFLSISFQDWDERNRYLDERFITNEKMTLFRKQHDAARLRMIIIDEISNMHPHLLGQLELFLRSAIPDSAHQPFGGLAILMMGDFLQLPPVGAARTLYDKVELFRADDQAGKHGASLFRSFTIRELKQQMRAADDVLHTRMLEHMRYPPPNTRRIDLSYIDNLSVLSPDDVVSDPTWATAPIVVNNNSMRHIINEAVSRNYARLHGRRRFVWRTPLTGKIATHLTAANENHLYERYPGLSGFFVKGKSGLVFFFMMKLQINMAQRHWSHVTDDLDLKWVRFADDRCTGYVNDKSGSQSRVG